MNPYEMEIFSSIKAMSQSFGGGQKDERLDYYRTKLIELGYLKDDIVKACKQAPLVFDYFPSLKQLLDLLRSISNSLERRQTKDQIEWEQHLTKVDEARVKTEQIREKYEKKYGEEKMKNYYIYFYKNVFGDKFLENYYKWGLELKAFQMPALLDLEAAGGDVKKAVEIGRKG